MIDDKYDSRNQSETLAVLTTSAAAATVDISVDGTDAVRVNVYERFKSLYPVEEWKSVGFFTEEFLCDINEHWLQFDPPTKTSHYTLAAMYAIIMTIGVVGNCLVIFMFLKCRSLRTPANILVMNLAISDLFLLLKMPIFIYNSLHFGPALGAIGCKLYGFTGGLTGTVSIMTLAAIGLDRYYVIVYPLDPVRKTTKQRAKLFIVFVWLYGCLFASLPLTDIGLNRYVPEGYLTSCSFDYLTKDLLSKIFIFVFFVAAWVVPFTVITVCYVSIFRTVIKAGSLATRTNQEQEKRKTELRLAVVVIGVIGLWFLAWTPYATVALLGISGNDGYISPLSSMLPALFCKTASCIDPFIYAVTHPRFRREFLQLFCGRETTKNKFGPVHSRANFWRTKSSRRFGIQARRNVESFSDDDFEEMIIMVNTKPTKRPTAADCRKRQTEIYSFSFPPSAKESQRLNSHSWFVSQRPKGNRPTSLKTKPKVTDYKNETTKRQAST